MLFTVSKNCVLSHDMEHIHILKSHKHAGTGGKELKIELHIKKIGRRMQGQCNGLSLGPTC